MDVQILTPRECIALIQNNSSVPVYSRYITIIRCMLMVQRRSVRISQVQVVAALQKDASMAGSLIGQ